MIARSLRFSLWPRLRRGLWERQYKPDWWLERERVWAYGYSYEFNWLWWSIEVEGGIQYTQTSVKPEYA